MDNSSIAKCVLMTFAIGFCSHAQAKYAIEFDGAFAGWLLGAKGGEPVGQVVTEKLGPDSLQKKRVSGLKYEDIEINLGFDVQPAVYKWIHESLANTHPRRTGAIVEVDSNGIEVRRTAFANALISEITFPAIGEGMADVNAAIALKFVPESTRLRRGPGGKFKGMSETKKNVPSPSARFTIDGLDRPLAGVAAMTFKLTHPASGVLDYPVEPGNIEMPNLVISLTESDSEDMSDKFYAWHEDFVIGRNSSDDKEKSASLVYLAAGKPLMSFNFRNLGIFKLSSTIAQGVRRLTASMYFEGAELKKGE